MSQSSFLRTNQKHLEKVLHQLFQGKKILTNVRKAGNVASPDGTGIFLELDLWIPELKLAFEFQDPHHYQKYTWHSFNTLTSVRKHDLWKQQILDERGENLIIVPCWWNGEAESLISTIRLQRPELFDPSSVPPISPTPPDGYFKDYSIYGFGEPTLPSFIDPSSDITSWWISEKYDGIRALWSASHSKLYSRYAREIEMPFDNEDVELNECLVSLDGELWSGRGGFQETQQIVNGEQEDNFIFSFLRYIVFDASILSSRENESQTHENEEKEMKREREYESRLRNALSFIRTSNPLLIVAGQCKCAGVNHVNSLLSFILADGGEGFIARKPHSEYEPGRSKLILKMKACRDGEALVVRAAENDEAAFIVQLPNGNTLSATSSLSVPPQPGAVVTILLSGTDPPSIPQIHRIRNDLDWQTICESENYDSQSDSLEIKEKDLNSMVNPAGFWTNDGSLNMRKFFDDYANKMNFDPLNANNWYNVKRKDIVEEKGGATILTYYGSSLTRCLTDLYPAVQFDAAKFYHRTAQYWHSSANRRKFLQDFATKHNFDPLSPSSWYLYTRDDLLRDKGGAFLNFYNGSMIKAVMDVFPNVRFDEIAFKRTKNNYWKFKENRRKFLEQFATKRGFAVTSAAKWYRITQEDILGEKGGVSFLNQYGMSLRKALIDLYPDIDAWELHRFRQIGKSSSVDLASLKNKTNRKQFFETMAQKRDFNPLIPANWYNITKFDFTRSKAGIYILQQYHGSVANAVMDMYPSIGLERKFF